MLMNGQFHPCNFVRCRETIGWSTTMLAGIKCEVVKDAEQRRDRSRRGISDPCFH